MGILVRLKGAPGIVMSGPKLMLQTYAHKSPLTWAVRRGTATAGNAQRK